MKVPHIIYPFPMHLSLGANYHQSITNFLYHVGKRARVSLLTLDSSSQLDNFICGNLGYSKNSNIELHTISNRFFGVKSNKIFSIRVFIFIRQAIKRTPFANIYVFSRDLKQLNYMIKASWLLSPTPFFVIESHQLRSLTYWRNGQIKKALKERRTEKTVYTNANYIAAISPTLSSEITINFNTKTTPFTLPVGVAVDFFNNPSQKKYDLIYAGGYASWKGLNTYYESLKILSRYLDHRLSVLFVGADEETKSSLLKEFSQFNNLFLEIKPRVPSKDIPRLLSESRIGIVTSSYQGDGLLFTSPLKIFEYLASGLQVVAPSTPPILSAFTKHNPIHWANPNSALDYAHQIRKILTMSEKEKEIRSASGRQLALRFTWENRAINFLSNINQKDIK